MPKNCLTCAQRVERYKRKVEEIERCEQRKRRRVIVYSDDSDDSDVDQGCKPLNDQHSSLQATDKDDEILANLPSENQVENDDYNFLPASENSLVKTAAAPSALETPLEEQSFLDPTLLAALGECISARPEFGPSVHDSLANLWLPLLKKGMSKENKEHLLKEYLIPNNCKLLQAPKLNAEISAAVTDVVRGRDKKYTTVQQQLGQGVTAINRAMDVMLKSDNKIEALKYLSDGCRILSDLHHFFTKDRIKLITPSLDKNFLHVVQDAERDETLFGKSLSDNIKASKAIEKQSQLIKRSLGTLKANPQGTTTTRPSTSQGNWSGPPRYSSNRGGRGGRKLNPASNTRRPYHTNAITPTRSPAQTKPRASILLPMLAKYYK